MGANGCGWMLMGALGHIVHKQHKNKVRGGNFWSLWSGYGSYGRGNFPRHDVCGCWPKWSRMGKDEYWCIRVGAMGLIVTGGWKKKTKRTQNGQAGHVFRGMTTWKKASVSQGCLRGPERAKGGNCVEFKGAQFGYTYVAKSKPKQLSNSSKKSMTNKRKLMCHRVV